MAAPYALQGMLARICRWIRMHANEPRVTPKYGDGVLLEYLSNSLAVVLEEVYGVAAHPPYSEFSLTLVDGQQRYILPPNIKEIHRLIKKDSTTGLPEWELKPGDKLTPGGPTVTFEGTRYVRFVPTPSGQTLAGQTLTLEYIPGGSLMLHQNATPVWAEDDDTGDQLCQDDTLYLSATEYSPSWLLGRFDRRADAYLGQIVRVLGTINDAAPTDYNFFPIQERQIQTYAVTDGKVTVIPDFDFDPADVTDKVILSGESTGRTYLLYEVLPAIDEAIFWLAAYRVAIAIARDEQREKAVQNLLAELADLKRGVLLRWSNFEQRVGHRFQADDWSDDGVS